MTVTRDDRGRSPITAAEVAALMGSIQSDASAQTYGNRDLSAEQHHPSTRSHPTKSKSAGDQE